ncbi:MAG: alpha/beta hydrolase [Alphaproteobacteria bacterium]|nr:alpha/beta hydrolase [Alphaproteobacteria bacterium]
MERIDVAGLSVEAVIAGEGPPLLFLHPEDYFAQHRPFLERLARHWRVIAPRPPGFGATERPQWFRTVHDLAHFHLDLIDRLTLDKVMLVGAGFGGWVALELAVRSVQRIERLVLIDALGVKFGGRDERDVADFYALPAADVLRGSFADPARTAPDYTRLDDAALTAIARDREAAALYGWKPFMHDPALVHWLHRITRPALVLWGDEDGIVTPAYGERLAAALPNARISRIPGAAHYPQIEQPEAVLSAMEAFAQGT